MTLTTNYIVQRGRALLAQCSPVTGTRATGPVLATATAGDVVVPRNTYLVPIRNGTLLPHHLYKVAPNPDTLASNGTGGDWTVEAGGTSLTILSNVGGARHNLAEGEQLQWDPPVPGLEPLVTVEAGGLTGGTIGAVEATSFYEEMAADTLLKAGLGHFPALMVVWKGTSPAEGKSLGLSKGRSRVARRTILWYETYYLYVIASRAESDPLRRREGLEILEDISGLLSDRSTNDDREALTVHAGGGVEIQARDRLPLGPKAQGKMYVYFLTLRLSRTQKPIDNRVFNPWLRTTMQVPLAADPPLAAKDVLDHDWEQDHPLNDEP